MKEKMKIAISGASGFIGSNLTKFLNEKGYETVALSREMFQSIAAERLAETLAGCDIVINLAGASIVKRWTEDYKKELIESRVQPTKAIVDALLSNSGRTSLLLSASAVGYYPAEGCYDEDTSRKGDGFLSEVCDLWEKEAFRASSVIRTVVTRFGIVLAEQGGAFDKLAFPARMGGASYFAPGDQPLTWIALQDLLNAMLFIMEHRDMSGIVNFTSPQKLTNKEFNQLLKQHYHSLTLLKVPGFLLKTMMGEAAVNLMEGQCVYPKRLQEKGFPYQYPNLEDFLASLKK